jgi:hypothetical protein
MNRTLLDECFRVAGRTTWYLEPAEIQRDLDRFLEYYNLQRSHQGYRLGGRTPSQALQEALGHRAAGRGASGERGGDRLRGVGHQGAGVSESYST